MVVDRNFLLFTCAIEFMYSFCFGPGFFREGIEFLVRVAVLKLRATWFSVGVVVVPTIHLIHYYHLLFIRWRRGCKFETSLERYNYICCPHFTDLSLLPSFFPTPSLSSTFLLLLYHNILKRKVKQVFATFFSSIHAFRRRAPDSTLQVCASVYVMLTILLAQV